MDVVTSAASTAQKIDTAMRIAVVIPVYNGAPYLEECISSALAQGQLAHEVVVVDDGSTDSTPSIIEAFAARDQRVRSIRLENHGRPAAPRNRGVEATTCDWVALLDADDVWHPNKLARQVAAWRATPHLIAIGGQARYLGTSGPMRGILGEAPTDDTWAKVRAGRYVPFLVPSTLVVRRSTFLEIGGFDEAIPAAEDLEFIARLAALGPIGYVEDEVALYRLRRDSMMGDSYFKILRMSRFVAARIEARQYGGDLTLEEFDAFDRLTFNERRNLHSAHLFRKVAVAVAEHRWATAAVNALGAAALAPLRTARRLTTKFSLRPTP